MSETDRPTLEALRKVATPRPWMVGYNGMIVDLVMGVVTDTSQTNRVAQCSLAADAEYIVALVRADNAKQIDPEEFRLLDCVAKAEDVKRKEFHTSSHNDACYGLTKAMADLKAYRSRRAVPQ